MDRTSVQTIRQLIILPRKGARNGQVQSFAPLPHSISLAEAATSYLRPKVLAWRSRAVLIRATTDEEPIAWALI